MPAPSSILASLIAFVRLGRPLFLGGGFLLYALGAVVAAWHGHPLDLTRYVAGQVAVTAFQLMTHYANDYFDYDADVANTTPTRWSGGSRVLAEGALPRRVALIAALVLALLGAGASGVVIHLAGAGVAPVLVAMGVLSWLYSAPPVRLCARGLGELDTAIVVTGLVPWLGFALQAPDRAGALTLLLAIAPLVLLQIAMLLAIEFPDAASDGRTGKRTLVVRLGAPRAAQLYVLITTLAFLALPIAYLAGLPVRVVIAATIPAPIAVWRIARIADHDDPSAFERLTLFGVVLLVGTTIAEVAAFASLIHLP